MGRATVERLVREGAKVTLVDLPTSDGEKVAAELKGGHGDRVVFAPCDVTNEADVKAALELTK